MEKIRSIFRKRPNGHKFKLNNLFSCLKPTVRVDSMSKMKASMSETSTIEMHHQKLPENTLKLEEIVKHINDDMSESSSSEPTLQLGNSTIKAQDLTDTNSLQSPQTNLINRASFKVEEKSEDTSTERIHAVLLP